VLAAITAQGVTAPLVVIAEKGEERRAIQAFRLGAADAILWPAKDAEIVRVVERSLQPTLSRRVRRQLYQQLDLAHEELRRSQRQLDAILSLATALGSGGDARRLLQRVPAAAVLLADADIAWLTSRDERTHEFLLQAHANLPSSWSKKLNQPLDDGLSSLVVLSGRPLTMHGKALEKFKVASLGRAVAVLPVKVRNDVLAALVVVRKEDQEIKGDSQRLLQGIADVAGAAVLQSGLINALKATSAAERQRSRVRTRAPQSVKTALEHLQRIESGEAGELTETQKEALAGLRISLEHVMRSVGKEE
jgi:transcriptional regulator with GAF, ATPase, and Fis domain